MNWDSNNPLTPVADEPIKAHQAFHDYVALGVSRSLAMLAQRYQASTDPTPTKHVRTLKQWSRVWALQARVAAWEAIQSEKVRQETEALWLERRRQMLQAEWSAGQSLLDKAREMLDFPLATVQKQSQRVEKEDGSVVIEEHITIQPTRWTYRDVVDLLEVSFRLGRLATGSALAEVQETSLSNTDLAALSDEELSDLALRLEQQQKTPRL